MKIDIKEFKKRAEFISCQEHPRLPLLIWNYTHRCQFGKAWDEYTTMARGLITDTEGNVIARPFKKFFNINETEETKIENLPMETPTITEKLDGSLGILYFDEETPMIATRGSFLSEQAITATGWITIREWDRDVRIAKEVLPGFTYLFEIIYPGNRIVVDYGPREELVLLAVIENESGKEIDARLEAKRLGFSAPRTFEGLSVQGIMDILPKLDAMDEGFVVRYSNGLRVKMKGAEYVRLHRLITGFSTKSIWECLMNGQDISAMMDRVPDEFYAWVRTKEDELRERLKEIMFMAKEAVADVSHLSDRKEIALRLQSEWTQFCGYAFSIIDGKDPSKAIWRSLKPKFELPFRSLDEPENSRPSSGEKEGEKG